MTDPGSGRWTWNDVTNSLEYTGVNPPGDRQAARKKDKRELKSETASAVQPNQQSQPGYGMNHRAAVRQPIKPTPEHMNVTLQDIKDVARYMMLEIEDLPTSFEGLCNTMPFNEFLLTLINYFHWFFEKRAKDNNPNPVHIELSMDEKKIYDEICLKLDIAQKLLGRIYGAMLLGIDLDKHHHMACGKSRVSRTNTDRAMYEALYSYSTFVVWIAFKRVEHDVISNEINRLLRTDTFNTALHAKPVAGLDDDGESKDEEKITEADFRRLQNSRPPLKSILNQRSTAVVSIVPLPKEEASWLFKRPKSQVPIKFTKKKWTTESIEQHFNQFDVARSQFKLGMIGESLNLFDPMTLAPLTSDEDEKSPSASSNEMSSLEGSILSAKPGVPQESSVNAQSQASVGAKTSVDRRPSVSKRKSVDSKTSVGHDKRASEGQQQQTIVEGEATEQSNADEKKPEQNVTEPNKE